jgi:hypothetical protein
MLDTVFLHAGATRTPFPHAFVDAVVGVAVGLLIVAVFYAVLRFYVGPSRSDL